LAVIGKEAIFVVSLYRSHHRIGGKRLLLNIKMIMRNSIDNNYRKNITLERQLSANSGHSCDGLGLCLALGLLAQ